MNHLVSPNEICLYNSRERQNSFSSMLGNLKKILSNRDLRTSFKVSIAASGMTIRPLRSRRLLVHARVRRYMIHVHERCQARCVPLN